MIDAISDLIFLWWIAGLLLETKENVILLLILQKQRPKVLIIMTLWWSKANRAVQLLASHRQLWAVALLVFHQVTPNYQMQIYKTILNQIEWRFIAGAALEKKSVRAMAAGLNQLGGKRMMTFLISLQSFINILIAQYTQTIDQHHFWLNSIHQTK